MSVEIYQILTLPLKSADIIFHDWDGLKQVLPKTTNKQKQTNRK